MKPIIRYCAIDNKPFAQSEAYRALRRLHGSEVAHSFNYDAIMDHGSNELKEAVFIVTGGEPPSIYPKERKAQ